MRLMYRDKYDIIDANMSDSNIGARKDKNIRNHIWILNGIILEAIKSSKCPPLDIQILDVQQCFDSLWNEECMNNLYEAGMDDNMLALLYEMNSRANIAVRTPVGITERREIKNSILQGDVFGPLTCSVQIDEFGRECIEEDQYMYYYRDKVGIPPLSQTDDTVCISICGFQSTMVNAFINHKTSFKKLQFGTEKCIKMHIGRVKEDFKCKDLYVDGWKIEETHDIQSGEDITIENNIGNVKMKETSDQKYLGDIISNDGKNIKNMQARHNKGNSVITYIMLLLEELCFGKYYFEVAIVLRNAIFLSSIIFNSEAWYNMTNNDIDMLESVDEQLLRRILDAPVTTAKEMLYLELGVIPIRHIIRGRRLNFLKYILQQDQTSLIYRFFQVQRDTANKYDWISTVIKDIEELDLKLTIDDIQIMPKSTFKRLVNLKTKENALNYLNELKSAHTKVMDIVHNELEMQTYLSPNICEMTVDDAKYIFLLRSRMVDVKANYKGKYFDYLCTECGKEEETQQHVLECSKLIGKNEMLTYIPNYYDIFSEEVEEQLYVARILRENMRIKKI